MFDLLPHLNIFCLLTLKCLLSIIFNLCLTDVLFGFMLFAQESEFERVWTPLNEFEQVWTGLNGFGRVWTSLNAFERVWTRLNTFERIWMGLNAFEHVWMANVMDYDYSKTNFCSGFIIKLNLIKKRRSFSSQKVMTSSFVTSLG